jgi:hypothetical protein
MSQNILALSVRGSAWFLQKVSNSTNGGAPNARTRLIDSSNPTIVNIRTGNAESYSSFFANARKNVLTIAVICGLQISTVKDEISAAMTSHYSDG